MVGHLSGESVLSTLPLTVKGPL